MHNITVTLPDGTVETRRTARSYSHVVAVRLTTGGILRDGLTDAAYDAFRYGAFGNRKPRGQRWITVAWVGRPELVNRAFAKVAERLRYYAADEAVVIPVDGLGA